VQPSFAKLLWPLVGFVLQQRILFYEDIKGATTVFEFVAILSFWLIQLRNLVFQRPQISRFELRSL